MSTSNEAAKKDDAILENNDPQKEQEEVNGDKEVPKSNGNLNPTASTNVSFNDLFEIASSSTVETEVPTVSTPIPTSSLSVPLVTSSVPRIISRGGSSYLEPISLGNAMSFENRLEDLFGDTFDVVSLNDVEADLRNKETAIQFSPTPTLRIHKDHPKSQIIGPVDTPVQTKQKTKNVDEQSFITTIHQKINPDLLHYCLFSYIRAAKTPMDRENPWGNDRTGKDVDLYLYRSMIGSLMYLTASRSNIMFSLCACARHQVTPKECHLYDVKRIFRDVRYGEAFPTVTRLDAGQDRENIAKTSDMSHEASPRVTYPGGEERRIGLEGCSKHEGINKGEDLLVGDTVKDSDKSADKESDSTDEMANVLGTLGATNILAIGGLRSVFTTASLSVATASTDVSHVVATASESFPTATISTTASVATPTTRVTRSSRGVVIESSFPISVNIPSISKKDKRKGDLEAKFAQEDQIIKEQAERDYEITKIHAERELEMMIVELDRSNEMVAKYLSEYQQAEVGLSHDEKVELIDELIMYQRHLAQIKKYKAQQNKPAIKTKRRNFYMLILRSNASWKAKDFKGMTFEHIEEKFILVWEKMQDFVPMNSKLESERLKRLEIQLDKESFKKLKTTKSLGTKPTQEQQSEEHKELSKEELKKMMELVPVEELYIEAL
uniref:Putative Gag-Pol polyprotein n=1 Tax=Tanacetum cinerariifolium TaxID=118510 RepID=A0A6L2J7W0_TANCI|nr:putative Gag-Pol polyprotein [Tanacetum cinerariifolium]